VLTRDGQITVSGYDVPPSIPQPGGSSDCSGGDCLDSLDARLTQAVAHYDPSIGRETVWTQHAVVSVGPLSVERWYELIPSLKTIRQWGNISDPNQHIFN